MQTKLTLRLDEALIKKTKLFAKMRGLSLSQMVSQYFASLNQSESKPVAPITRTLRGVMKNLKVREEDYKKHLEDKYL